MERAFVLVPLVDVMTQREPLRAESFRERLELVEGKEGVLLWKKNMLAQRIRAFRKLKGFTQNELAERLDVSIAVLGSIERGTRKADPKIILKISETLGIDPEELAPAMTSLRSDRA